MSKTYFNFIETTKSFLQEAKVSESNLEKAVGLFVSLFERKAGTKLYRFGGPKGYSEIKNGIGILFFYDVKKAIRFNYSSGSLDSITLWDSYKLGKKGDRTISFEDLSLFQAGKKIIDFIISNKTSGTETVLLDESVSHDFLMEAKRISVKQAASLVISKLPSGVSPKAVSTDTIKDILSAHDFQIPFDLRKYKSARGRWDIEAVLNDPDTSDKPATNYEKEYTISVSSGDPLSSENLSLNQTTKAKELTTAIKDGLTNPNIKKEMEDPDSLFGIMKNLIQVVCRKARNSLIIYGGPGTGKTFTVLETVKEEGLSRNQDFFVIKGKVTTAELYRTLFMHRNGKLLVFDDTDSVWADKEAGNILKAALDSYDERMISWYSARTFNVSRLSDEEKEDYNQKVDYELDDPESKMKFPSEFLYNGRIIFISNLSYEKFDSAVLTRSAKVDMTLTDSQMFRRMEGILEHLGDKSIPKAIKHEILEFLKTENKSGNLQGISMRTFVAASDLYKSGLSNWQDLLAYI